MLTHHKTIYEKNIVKQITKIRYFACYFKVNYITITAATKENNRNQVEEPSAALITSFYPHQ